MSKKSKYEDLIKKIKEDNPIDQWNVKIKTAIAEEVKKKPVDNSLTDPMGIDGDKVLSYASIDVVREEAAKIIKAGKSETILVSQFVRPGKRKLSKVITDTENGKVYKKFRLSPPIGALVAFVHDHKLLVGWSKYNTGKEILPFSKKVAVETAVMRALIDKIHPHGANDYITAEDKYIPKAVSKEMSEFIKRIQRYFKREANNVGKFIGTA